MKKAIGLFYVFVLLQLSLTAQVIEMDSLFFQNLNNELLKVNDEVILDIDVEKELQNEIPKLKSILDFVLKNENYLVELSSHTSCVGNLIVNLKTSEERAEKLKNEIFNLADSSDFSLLKKNLSVVGKGEFNPLVKRECAHCAEQSHQQNDRVMIKLVRLINPDSSKLLNHKPSKSLIGRGGKGPSFDPKSQVHGKVVIRVCVDKNGIVIKSETVNVPEKSTITDPVVIMQAIETANKWKFKPSKEEIACGTVTYVIKIK